jgi:hypothetical protein
VISPSLAVQIDIGTMVCKYSNVILSGFLSSNEEHGIRELPTRKSFVGRSVTSRHISNEIFAMVKVAC